MIEEEQEQKTRLIFTNRALIAIGIILLYFFSASPVCYLSDTYVYDPTVRSTVQLSHLLDSVYAPVSYIRSNVPVVGNVLWSWDGLWNDIFEIPIPVDGVALN